MAEEAYAVVAEDYGRPGAVTNLDACWHARSLDRLAALFQGRPGGVGDRLLAIAFVALGAGVIVVRRIRVRLRLAASNQRPSA